MSALDEDIQAGFAWYFPCATGCVYNLHMSLLFDLVPNQDGGAHWAGGAARRISMLALVCFFLLERNTDLHESLITALVRLLGPENWVAWTAYPEKVFLVALQHWKSWQS